MEVWQGVEFTNGQRDEGPFGQRRTGAVAYPRRLRGAKFPSPDASLAGRIKIGDPARHCARTARKDCSTGERKSWWFDGRTKRWNG